MLVVAILDPRPHLPTPLLCPPAHVLRAARHAERRARLRFTAGYTFYRTLSTCLPTVSVQVPVCHVRFQLFNQW